MAMPKMLLTMDEKRLVSALQEAQKEIAAGGCEVVLDFSNVRRVEPSALRAMEEFVHIADEKGAKVVLRGVNVDVYKVLKLLKLAPQFSFAG